MLLQVSGLFSFSICENFVITQKTYGLIKYSFSQKNMIYRNNKNGSFACYSEKFIPKYFFVENYLFFPKFWSSQKPNVFRMTLYLEKRCYLQFLVQEEQFHQWQWYLQGLWQFPCFAVFYSPQWQWWSCPSRLFRDDAIWNKF